MGPVCDADTEDDENVRSIPVNGHLHEKVDCFHIEEEISYWRNARKTFEDPRLNYEDALYIDLVKFAYDSYVYYGRQSYESAKERIMQRFSASSLRRRCDWATVDKICGAVWTKMIAGYSA